MSLAIAVTTTANRTRRFFQIDPARVTEILDSLKRCSQLFTGSTLVIVTDDATESSTRRPLRASRSRPRSTLPRGCLPPGTRPGSVR